MYSLAWQILTTPQYSEVSYNRISFNAGFLAIMQYPEIDPIALQLGPVAIHWYGLMYLLSFLLVYLIGNYRANRIASGWNKEQISDLIFFGAPVGLWRPLKIQPGFRQILHSLI